VATDVIAPSPQRVGSADFWVTLFPRTVYTTLAQESRNPSIYAALKRPLFLAFALGCTVSVITAQTLIFRLVVGGTINMSFVPAVQIAGLYVVSRRRSGLSFPHLIDLFFMGQGPWILGMLAYAAVWAFATPEHAIYWTLPSRIWPAILLAVVWSAYIDFCFFRCVFRDGKTRAAWNLATQRLVSWSLGILIFGAGAIPAHIMGVLGR